MTHFIVTIKTATGLALEYPAIAFSTFDLHAEAIDRFGLCKFSARRA